VPPIALPPILLPTLRIGGEVHRKTVYSRGARLRGPRHRVSPTYVDHCRRRGLEGLASGSLGRGAPLYRSGVEVALTLAGRR
jgi:hypothetical protein